MSVFTKADFDARVTATRRKMAAQGIDLLICTDPSNMHYLTGYDGWSFYVPQAVAVAQDEDEPLWLGRGIDANGARATTFLPDANIVAYGDHYVQSRERHPMDAMAAELVRRGWAKGVVGCEMDDFYFSPRALAALKAGMPNARFVEATGFVGRIRSVKTEKELDLMRTAARILERAMQVGIDMIDPQYRQCDAAAEILKAQVRGLPEAGGDYTAITPLLATGKGTGAPHLTATDAHFRREEVTILEIAGAHRRYHAPMARTVFPGTPPQAMVDTAKIVVEGIHAAFAVAKPGNTCGDVAQAWTDTIERHGIHKESRCGYPIGIGYPPDWGERTMSLRPGDPTVLEPNMTFHFMPGIWTDDWGVAISEPMRVTETGGESLANVPRELIVK